MTTGPDDYLDALLAAGRAQAELVDRPLTAEERRELAVRAGVPYLAHGIRTWVKAVDDFGYAREPGGKLPRATVRRPYRIACQDHIVALFVVRHAKESDALEVEVFLAYEPFYLGEPPDDLPPPGQPRYPYKPLTAARALTLTLLSEAFRCGASLRLRFTRDVERADGDPAKHGRVPAALVQLAALYGVEGIDPESGVLEPAQARPLYIALTQFPPDLDTAIRRLAADGLLSAERASYLIHHGVWSVPELEGIVRSSPYPDLVLDGEVPPEQRSLYRHAQLLVRTALLGGMLDRVLTARNPAFPKDVTAADPKIPKGRDPSARPALDTADGQAAEAGQDVEDHERDVRIAFDPAWSARRYTPGPLEADPLDISADWQPAATRGNAPPWKGRMAPGGVLVALLRARDEAELLRELDDDLRHAGGCPKPTGGGVAVVVPKEFDGLPPDEQQRFLAAAAAAGVWLVVAPERTAVLDANGRTKLTRSRVLPE